MGNFVISTITYIVVDAAGVFIVVLRIIYLFIYLFSPEINIPEGSLLHSQVPTTCLFPEPAQSSPYNHIPLPEDPA